MENNHTNLQPKETWKQAEKNHKRGKVFGGLLIVVVGSLFLAKELGANIPQWIFTWKMFLIAVGLMIGVKHKFLHPGWLILILIGSAFLLTDIYPGIIIKPILWPVLIILFGLFIMFKPRRKNKELHWKKWQTRHQRDYHHYQRDCFIEETSETSEDFIDSTVFMGAVKKNIISKDFKGGDVTVVFGGAELNLSQADITGKATLEITQVFAGTKLIIPANWEINSELVSVFGSIEDKRPIQPNTNVGPQKILVLKGTTFFGGIDIKSY